MSMIRTYSDLQEYETFEERFAYLSLDGSVGQDTFGFDRYINQMFYTSSEWKRIRQHVILRDGGCDLGIPDREIRATLLVHHINPMRKEDLIHGAEWVLDPEYLITTMHSTHNAIHFGSADLLPKPFIERVPGDTRLWGK